VIRCPPMERRLPALVTAVAALLCFVATFGDALGSLSSRFLGLEYVDHYGTQWFYWYIEHQIRSGQGPGHTDLFFYPWGKDIFAHTGSNVFDAFLAVPFRMSLGHVLGYNTFVLVGMALSAAAFALLAKEATDDKLAIGVGSVLFAFSPYGLFELMEGRPTQAILLFPVLFVLYTWRTGLRPGWKAPAAAGLMLALSGYQYWYYAFFGGMVCLAHGLWRTAYPAEGSGGRLWTFLRHGGIAAVALGFCLPVAAQLLFPEGEVPGLLDADKWSLYRSPPVTVEKMTVGLFLWQPFRGSTGFYLQGLDGTESFLARMRWTPFTLTLLAILGAWRPGKLQRGPVLAMIAMASFIALGPVLLLGQMVLPNPPYILMVKAVGFLQRLWWPARAYAFDAIVAGWLAVAGLAELRRLVTNAWLASSGGLAVTGLWMFELWRIGLAPFPTWDAYVPAGYQCLASGPPGAIIELPYSWTQGHLYYQIVHGRPIHGGMLENNATFTPAESEDLRTKNTFVKRLLDVARPDPLEGSYTEEDKAAFHELGYRYVVVQKDAFYVKSESSTMLDSVLGTRLRRMRKELNKLLGMPVYEDARVAIYAPWGDPVPCDTAALTPDKHAVGQTDVSPEQLLEMDPDQRDVWRLVEASDTGVEEGADTDADADGEAPPADAAPPAADAAGRVVPPPPPPKP
jgi:hypothetical protein